MLEIGSILEKFNTINSQLIQYWWYWFCTISVSCIGIQNIQMLIDVLQQEIRGNCGGTVGVLIYWLVYIVTLILVILPVTVFLFFAQKWFVPTGAIHIYNNSILMLIQKIVSSVFGLIHIVSILTVIVFFAYLIFRK